MSEKHFTHLHLHTDHSLLDGAISIDKLIDYGKKNNRKALAISDHGNIFAAVKFFEKCKKAKIKPILGMEAYLTESVNIRNNNNRYYHLLLIVENEAGYKNLCKLISASYTKGFYFKPRIDYELLQKHSEGLIATSTCIGGHVPQLILAEKFNEAKDRINILRDIFPDRYYLEVQPTYQEEQLIINNKLFEFEKELDIPMIVTGDCHYATKEDHYAHEVMLAIQTRSTMSDPNRMTFGKCRAHMQSIDELREFFPERDDIIWRTGEIADRCNFEFSTGKLFFPKFEVPKEHTDSDNYFEYLSKIGFEKLINKNKIPSDLIEKYKERLDEEIKLIIKMGFATYFLIVSDFIIWAKNNGIAVGPGRGSVAGSLVAWALEITDIDPIKYNLLFERFLNPERVSMPDVDVDFCIEGREKVIQYVKNKYGHDKVGQIITFGSMQAKGVIKDVARALGFSFEDANSITDLIPEELKITLKDAFDQESRLRDLCDKNPKIAELFDIATRLEGLTRHSSKHAAGIVISPDPIAEVLPIYIPAKSNDIVTQYGMTELELLGFLKMDFLGLKNLTLITDIIQLIKKNHNFDIDVTNLNLQDDKTFELLCNGDTAGVFQFESSGIRDVLRRLQPTGFEDLIAVNALYRPGPLGSGMVDDFINRRHGKEDIKYLFPELEPILKDTYGVIVYQEQVMKISSAIAGYSLGESDILRRAMGKKKADVMAEQKEKFVKNAIERGFCDKKASELFELMEYFAGYGFNKSHSAAYAMIAYQTAYLKAHYKVEFMSCLISLELSNPDTTTEYLNELKFNKIKILQPNVNISQSNFLPENGAMRFGLLGIKNVGDTACKSIVKERENGKFKDLYDFCSRIDLRVCNKRVIENLISSGACDEFGYSRAEMIANLDSTIEIAQIEGERRKSGQLGLFEFSVNDEAKNKISWKKVAPWSTLQSLEQEKDVLGIYLSQHPIDEYDELFKNIGVIDILTLKELKSKKVITRGVLISTKEIVTKKGDRMAFATLEDQNSKIEVVFFSSIYLKYENLIKGNSLLLIIGEVSNDLNVIKIKAEKVFSLNDFNFEKDISEFFIYLNKDNFDIFKKINNKIKMGSQKIILSYIENNIKLEHHLKNNYLISKELINDLFELNIKCKINLL